MLTTLGNDRSGKQERFLVFERFKEVPHGLALTI